MKNLRIIALVIAVSMFSCSDDDDDIPQNNEPTQITYSNTISAIMTTNCTSCHGSPTTNGAPMSLNTYTDVKDAVENRSLISAVESDFMPPSGNLTSTQIQNIKTWQSNGFPQ